MKSVKVSRSLGSRCSMVYIIAWVVLLFQGQTIACGVKWLPGFDKDDAGSASENFQVVYWSEKHTLPRSLCLHFIRIDLTDKEYEVFTIVSDDPDGPGPAEAVLISPVELAYANRAVAAVNANAFRPVPGSQEKGHPKWHDEGLPVDIRGLVVSGGRQISPQEKGRAALWVDDSGGLHTGQYAENEKVAQSIADWSGRKQLLHEGRILVEKGGALHPRTLVGYDKDGRWLLLAVIDGRQEGYSEGLNLYECAKIMQDHGCDEALNLDGGGSSIMLLEKEGELKVMNRPSDGRNRPVPVMLGIRKTSGSVQN